MVATIPFATSADVASFNIGFTGGLTDFSDSEGPISKTAVDTTISLIGNHVAMQFQSAGYVIPFQVISGETWLSHQDEYLKLVVVLGTSAKLFNHLLNAYPGAVRSGGRLGNLFDEQYGVELRKIYDYQTGETQVRLRASYREGTPAERVLKRQYGPILDFHMEAFDPMTTLSFQDTTDLAFRIQRAFQELKVPWDYMHELTGRGLGPTKYDN